MPFSSPPVWRETSQRQPGRASGLQVGAAGRWAGEDGGEGWARGQRHQPPCLAEGHLSEHRWLAASAWQRPRRREAGCGEAAHPEGLAVLRRNVLCSWLAASTRPITSPEAPPAFSRAPRAPALSRGLGFVFPHSKWPAAIHRSSAPSSGRQRSGPEQPVQGTSGQVVREGAIWVDKAAWTLGMGDSGARPGPWRLKAILFAVG